MTAKTPRGNTIILRPDNVGKSTQAYIGYDEAALLKVCTFVGYKQTGTGFLGIFNTTQNPLTELVRLDEFPGTETGEYVVRSHRTGKVCKPMSRANKAALVSLEVPEQDWEILASYALRSYDLKRHGDAGSGSPSVTIANLGLIGRMTGAAAVINTDIYVDETGRLRFWTSLKALGVFGRALFFLPHHTGGHVHFAKSNRRAVHF